MQIMPTEFIKYIDIYFIYIYIYIKFVLMLLTVIEVCTLVTLVIQSRYLEKNIMEYFFSFKLKNIKQLLNRER